jgi:hypothetical protein
MIFTLALNEADCDRFRFREAENQPIYGPKTLSMSSGFFICFSSFCAMETKPTYGRGRLSGPFLMFLVVSRCNGG